LVSGPPRASDEAVADAKEPRFAGWRFVRREVDVDAVVELLLVELVARELPPMEAVSD